MNEQPANTPPQTPAPESLTAPPPQPVTLRLETSKSPPYISYILMAITILVYLAQLYSQNAHEYDKVAEIGRKVNELIVQGQYWRLITPVFLHGSILHIGFNMYALNLFGPSLERYYGHWQFLALYLITGFSGVVGSFAFTASPSLGASTAIFGLLAAHGVFAYRNQGVFGARARSAFQGILRIALINLLIGLTPGIDNWGHLGGLLGGLMIAWLGGPVYTIKGSLPALEAVNQRGVGQYIFAAGLTFFVFAILTIIIMIF